MNNKQFFEAKVAGKTLKFQVGGLADQASGHCLAQMGDTSVLVTAQIGNTAGNLGFFPLTCDYEERYYAAGKILGSRFVRREGRPTSEATLIARMTDRAIRPLFPQELRREVQIISTCLSWDAENDPAVLGLLGASLSLSISPIPWQGPIASVRVAKIDNEFILFPSYEQREKAGLDIIFAATQANKEILINMIEGKAEEISESEVLEAYDFALPYLNQLIDFIKEVSRKAGIEKVSLEELEVDSALEKKVSGFLRGKIEPVLYQKDKKKIEQDMEQVLAEAIEMVKQEFGEEKSGIVRLIFEKEQEKVLDEKILKEDKRPDGRRLDELRDIAIEAGILPRTHGSGLFTRGQTRVLSILTLGGPSDQQLLEGMDFSGKKRFMHHYNFPPYCSGEVKRLGSPGRREIGHGMLAEKALLPLIPSFDDFPYTIRVVSEVLSSNGSTSMASVSAASMALMDAGVPIKRPGAGIAVGLIKQSDKNYKFLTDIQGPEDHFGDMDFKIAGTTKGITALQMDVKTDGLTKEILSGALEKAKKARLEILDKMQIVLAKPRPSLSKYAPRVEVVQINPDKIGAVIGTGGKVINSIIDECGVEIDIEEDGRVFVSAVDDKAIQKAVEWIKGLTKEFKVGETFQGVVRRIVEFGAFVEIAPGQDGLVHISQLANFRVNRTEDVLKVGDSIPVKIIAIDEQGRISLSAKEAGFSPKVPAGYSVNRTGGFYERKPKRGFLRRR